MFAVHISDGILAWPLWVGGFVLLAALLWLGLRSLDEDEIPRIAVMSAAFFVAAAPHAPLPMSSAHLLLNGLVGVVLGWRAVAAILVGLFLQVLLLNHGGFTTLGVNACVMFLPALAAGLVFRVLHRIAWVRHPLGRALLVACSTLLWLLCLVFTVGLTQAESVWLEMDSGVVVIRPILEGWVPHPHMVRIGRALDLTLHPAILATALALACAIAWIERRLENAPEFPLGLLLGVLTVLLTVALNCAVLFIGAAEFGPGPAIILVFAHLPVAVVEGLILGALVGFLARVKPEMLGIDHAPVPSS
jgi:cobalt/nickel transport system permease protein